MKRKVILYALSTIIVVTVAALLRSHGLSDQFFTVYMPLAFFTVAGLDFYQTQVIEDGASNRIGNSFADRFLAYLFFAPFIFPARVYEKVMDR